MKKARKVLALMMALAMAGSLGMAKPVQAAEPAKTVADWAPSHSADEFTPDEQNVVIMINHSSAESTVLHRSCEKYAELLTEYSGGAIQATVYPNGTLFSVAEMNEAIKDGSVQVIAGSPGSATAASLGIFELPNLIQSFDQAHEVMQSGNDFREILNDLFDAEGIRLQSIEPCDFRMLTSNKEVRSYADITGLKIRVMDAPVPMSYWAQWGAQPTPLAWSEVYMSLQQGMVEAQENPYDSILGSNLQEVQKYVIDTRHVMFYTGFMMNKAFYESRTDNMKAIIDAAAEDAAAYAYADALDSSAANLQKLLDAGVEFIEFTEDDWANMRANATKADDLVKESIGEELFNKMMAALGF